MSRSFVTSMLGSIVFLTTVPALADDSAHDKAAAAFSEGRKLIEQGNCEAAVPKLRESLQWESSIGARLSIADCVEKNDPLAAWRSLKEAAALALMNKDERIGVAEQRAAGLQSRLAMLVFKLPGGTEQAGFELRVDGELVDRFFYRGGYATSPGKHLIEASAPGRRFSGSVTVDAGVQAPVDVDLRADECKKTPTVTTPTPTPMMTEFDRGASRRTLGLAIGGFGVASIASGVVFGLLTLDKKKSIEDACGGSAGDCAAPPGSVDPERESAKTMAAISTVSFIVGGAALIGGGLIYFTAPSAMGPKTGNGVRLSPRASAGGAGAFLEGTW